MGDGGQTFGGLPDTPDGMLCDNGNPGGCNYMQCGAGRRQLAAARGEPQSAAPESAFPSKRRETNAKWERTQDFARDSYDETPTLESLKKLHAGDTDTAAVGHDVSFAICRRLLWACLRDCSWL